MRTIKCDKCGCEQIFTSNDDTFAELRYKHIYVIVGSDRASDEPEQRVEQKRDIDLCLNCQEELKQVYAEAATAAFAVIGKWLNSKDDYKCDKCGHVDYQYYEHNFCPNCGVQICKEIEEE